MGHEAFNHLSASAQRIQLLAAEKKAGRKVTGADISARRDDLHEAYAAARRGPMGYGGNDIEKLAEAVLRAGELKLREIGGETLDAATAPFADLDTALDDWRKATR